MKAFISTKEISQQTFFQTLLNGSSPQSVLIKECRLI
jgi:hypothetical protein